MAKDATAGRRIVFVNGATGSATIAVGRTMIDYIKVTPQAGLARVGGANFPKQFQQFEAIAYANGPDGKPDTNDDIELGPVNASWAIEEYTATFDDDDKDFVGTIDAEDRTVHAESRRPEPEAQAQREQLRRRVGRRRPSTRRRPSSATAARGGRSRRARICSSPCRSTSSSTRRRWADDGARPARVPPVQRRRARASCISCRAPRSSRSTRPRRPCCASSPNRSRPKTRSSRALADRFDAGCRPRRDRRAARRCARSATSISRKPSSRGCCR